MVDFKKARGAKPGKALVKWDEQLAKEAAIAAAMEANAGGGQFFSLKSGVLSWQDAPMPDNQMAVVILDHIFENVFYEGEYDAANPTGPMCFAFACEETKLQPHTIVVEAHNEQHAQCAGCPQNEFGTAIRGKGKACKNTRRLAMIPAGEFKNGKFTLIDDEDHFLTTPVGYMKIPVTSVKGFAGFVKQVAGALSRPPHGIVTKVRVLPDSNDQFKVLFEPVMKIPDGLMGAVMQRREEVVPVIDFPYPPNEAPEEKPAKGKAAKPATRRAAPQRPAAPPARGARRY